MVNGMPLKRQRQVIVRFTDAEYFRLFRTAQQAGGSLSGFIRRCCFSDKNVVVIDRNAVRDLYAAVNAIGNNLNQLTRMANTNRYVSEKSIRRVEAWFDEIKRTMDEKLGGIKR
jgi:hypothetical protein